MQEKLSRETFIKGMAALNLMLLLTFKKRGAL